MTVPHHDLLSEFPEFKERIHTLKVSDAHFRRLFEEYNALDVQVRRIEDEVEHASDDALEDLKKKRLALKDQLFGLLKNAA